MLGIGAAMLGSPHVIGIDIDEDALQTAQENCEQYEDLQVGVMAVCIIHSLPFMSNTLKHVQHYVIHPIDHLCHKVLFDARPFIVSASD